MIGCATASFCLTVSRRRTLICNSEYACGLLLNDSSNKTVSEGFCIPRSPSHASGWDEQSRSVSEPTLLPKPPYMLIS